MSDNDIFQGGFRLPEDTKAMCSGSCLVSRYLWRVKGTCFHSLKRKVCDLSGT